MCALVLKGEVITMINIIKYRAVVVSATLMTSAFFGFVRESSGGCGSCNVSGSSDSRSGDAVTVKIDKDNKRTLVGSIPVFTTTVTASCTSGGLDGWAYGYGPGGTGKVGGSKGAHSKAVSTSIASEKAVLDACPKNSFPKLKDSTIVKVSWSWWVDPDEMGCSATPSVSGYAKDLTVNCEYNYCNAASMKNEIDLAETRAPEYSAAMKAKDFTKAQGLMNLMHAGANILEKEAPKCK